MTEMPGRDSRDPVSPEIDGAEPAVCGRSVPTDVWLEKSVVRLSVHHLVFD